MFIARSLLWVFHDEHMVMTMAVTIRVAFLSLSLD